MNERPALPRRLATADAERVLARAASLDVQRQSETVDVAALRQAAVAAGIDPDAFDAALAEAAATPAEDARPPGPRPPWIVRISLLGVPNRWVAWGYYAFFTLALLGSVIAALALPAFAPQRAAVYAPMLLFVALWAMFALWSTNKAIQWADRHGWDRLHDR
jgi:hypothetical protein